MAFRELVFHPFEPVFDEQSRILILGSFPSVVSRQQSFYYANRFNRFWPVMERLYDETIIDRAAFCHNHHIALWDVIHSCEITGSSDQSISNVVCNDIGSLVKQTEIHHIFTTGSRASELYRRHISLSLPHTYLPSTSSANARMRLNDLVQAYEIIRRVADEEN